MPAPSYGNVLQMIGNTPLMAVPRLDTGPCELFLKLENQNPGGSIKDRIGLYLIEAAERAGAAVSPSSSHSSSHSSPNGQPRSAPSSAAASVRGSERK